MKPALLGLTLIILGACRSANGGGAQTPAPGPPTNATVHELLASNALVGRMVEVTGRCLGYSSPTVAQGSPPVTRSDWQLEDGGEAIWVTGPMPEWLHGDGTGGRAEHDSGDGRPGRAARSRRVRQDNAAVPRSEVGREPENETLRQFSPEGFRFQQVKARASSLPVVSALIPHPGSGAPPGSGSRCPWR